MYYSICNCSDNEIWLTSQLLQVKKKKRLEKFKSSVLKVVAVAYETWSLARGFNYNNLTGKKKINILGKGSCRRGGSNVLKPLPGLPSAFYSSTPACSLPFSTPRKITFRISLASVASSNLWVVQLKKGSE